MFSGKFAALFLFFGITSVLAGCAQDTTKDQIAQAQLCLDKATDGPSANACVAKIASINTPDANALRCAAGFIGAGITRADNLSKALNAMKNSNGSSSVTTMMSFLNLGTNQEAQTIFNYCVASDDKGMALISAMAKSATTLINLVGPSYDPSTGVAQLEPVITDLVQKFNANQNDPSIQDTLSSIGSAVNTVYDMTCGGTVTGNSDICKSIDDALTAAHVPNSGNGSGIDLSSTDPKELASALLKYWNQQNGH